MQAASSDVRPAECRNHEARVAEQGAEARQRTSVGGALRSGDGTSTHSTRTLSPTDVVER